MKKSARKKQLMILVEADNASKIMKLPSGLAFFELENVVLQTIPQVKSWRIIHSYK